MLQKYNGEGDILELKRTFNDKIKIGGFRCKDVRQELKSIFDKAASLNFPESWEDVE